MLHLKRRPDLTWCGIQIGSEMVLQGSCRAMQFQGHGLQSEAMCRPGFQLLLDKLEKPIGEIGAWRWQRATPHRIAMVHQRPPELSCAVVEPFGMQTCRIDQGTGLSQQGHHRGLAHSAEGIQQARISTLVGPDRQQRPWEEDRHPTGALWCLALQLCSWSNPEALTGTADQWIRLISLLLQRGAVLRDPKHSKICTLAAQQLQTTSITMQLHQDEWANVCHTNAGLKRLLVMRRASHTALPKLLLQVVAPMLKV